MLPCWPVLLFSWGLLWIAFLPGGKTVEIRAESDVRYSSRYAGPPCNYTLEVSKRSNTVNAEEEGHFYYSPKPVILLCLYTLEQEEQDCNIEWFYREKSVLQKHSNGIISYAEQYDGRVRLGEGCSLVISQPCVTDSGEYQVSIIAANDNKTLAKKSLNLTVTESHATKLVYPECKCSQGDVNSTEEIRGPPGIAYPLAVFGPALLRILFITLYHFTYGRHSPASLSKGYLTFIFCLLSTGLILGALAMSSKEPILFTASLILILEAAGLLMLLIYKSFLQVRVKKLNIQLTHASADDEE